MFGAVGFVAIVAFSLTGGELFDASEEVLKTLSDSDLKDALRLGHSGNPEAYDLKWSEREGDGSESIVATVYTPFVRAALWAATNRNSGPLEPEAIPRHLLEPTVVVAVARQPDCCPPLEPGGPIWVGGMLVVPSAAPPFLCTNPAGEPALWARTDVSWLRTFDPQNANGVAAIVAFPLSVFVHEQDVVIEQHWRALSSDQIHHFVHYGRVRKQDLVAWR